MSIMSALSDIDELNRQLDADPGLKANMAEMGFIRLVGFHKDHNDQLTSKWEFTEHGRREMLSRLNDGLEHALKTGQEKLQ